MTEKKLSTLVINQVESIDVYNLLKTQGKINQDELYLISGEPDIITGIKGNKETTYRTGNVNLTPADIGALPDTTEIPTVPTNIGAFDNDVGYLTQHQSLTDYPKKTELANVATSGDYTDLINTPTIPSTKGLATETYVQNKIAEVVNSAPGTLDTLNELAQALGNDPNFATTMATELGKKANTANLATVATSGSYNDLINTPTIPSVGNGILTIQKNGTSAGTFTANATTNKTINITVPTKVSELTDDVVKGKYLSLTGGTMDSTYTPSANGDVATKQYVDNSTPTIFTASKAGTVPASGGETTKYLRADGTWTTIDKTPVIGTNTDYAIYIGTTAPASGTTPLLWIDTTSSTGFLKYRSSNTSAWTAVPVAWTE